MVSQWSEELRTKSVVISGHGDAKFSVGLGAGAGRDGLVVRHRVLNYRRYCGRLPEVRFPAAATTNRLQGSLGVGFQRLAGWGVVRSRLRGR